jgi:colanic acid biosynthesis glycosyl transferase WcaI
MRIAIVSAVFPPEPVMSAKTAADLAGALAGRGHEVTVLTSFPNRPAGILMDGMRRRWRLSERRDGYRVVHCWHSLSRTSGFRSRLCENLSFGLSSALEIVSGDRYDAVYMDTWPVFAQAANSVALGLRRTPIVCAVQDIYPESLVDKRMLNRWGLPARVLLAADRGHLRRCKRVVTLSPAMARLLRQTRGLEPDRVLVVPNWLDSETHHYSASTDNAFRRKHGIPAETLVAMFAGSLTLSAGPAMYVRAAELLKERRDILILLAGDGPLRRELEEQVSLRRLDNIRVISPLRQSEVPEVQAAADVLLLSLAGSMSHSAAPSKQVAYLFSGRPVVASLPADGYPAQIVRDADAGYVLPPDDPEAVAGLLAELKEHPLGLAQMGLNARRYAEEHFSRQKVLPRLVELLETVARHDGTQPAETRHGGR